MLCQGCGVISAPLVFMTTNLDKISRTQKGFYTNVPSIYLFERPVVIENQNLRDFRWNRLGFGRGDLLC